MHIEQPNAEAEVVLVEQPTRYQFVIDQELAYVGGGQGLMDY